MDKYDKIITKWMWMTDYCKKMLWNPCDSYFWLKAEQEYEKKLLTLKIPTYTITTPITVWRIKCKTVK